MEIQGLGSIQPLASVSRAAGQDETGDFGNILADAIKKADETAAQSKEGAIALLTGNVDDISGTIIDGEKADVSLRLAIQIRNKVIDAYNEVMRMQV